MCNCSENRSDSVLSSHRWRCERRSAGLVSTVNHVICDQNTTSSFFSKASRLWSVSRPSKRKKDVGTGIQQHQHPAGAQPEPIQIWIFSNKPSSKWFCYYPLSRATPTAQHARPWSAASLWIMQGASPKFPLSAASTIINAHWKAKDLVSKCSCYTRHRSGGGDEAEFIEI